MRTLRAATAGLFLLGASLVIAQDSDAIKKDKDLLKGLWKFESVEHEQGKKEDLGEATLQFAADGQVVFTKGNETKKASYTINPAGKPKEIDLKLEGKDEMVQGIYKIDKEVLTMCIREGQNAARPTEFVAKDRSVLVILKRVKE